MSNFILLLLVLLICYSNGYVNSSKSSSIIRSSSSSSSSLKSTKTDGKKKNWEIGRFLKTWTFYNSLKIPIISNLINPIKTDTIKVKPGDIIWSKDEKKVEWGPLDDVVMGGISKSDLNVGQIFDGKWTGFVTSENNGGFSGIRSKLFEPKIDASSCRGVCIRIKGDGNRYKFIARDDIEWNGTAWSTSFDTISNKFIDMKIPFTKLKPTRFSRTLTGVNPFNSKYLCGIQFTLSKFEYDGALNPKFTEGFFNVELESIKLF